MGEKKRSKKILTVMLAVVLAVTLAGCGGKGSAKNKANQKEMKELVYKAEPLAGMDQIKGDISSFAVTGDTLYLYTTEWVEGEAVPVDEEAVTVGDTDTEDVGDTDTEDAEDSDTDDATAEDADAPAPQPRDKEDADGTDAKDADETDAKDADETDAKDTDKDAGETEDADGDAEDADVEEEVEYTYTTNQYFYRMKTDGSELTTLMERLDNKEQTEWLNSFVVGSDGDIYMLYSFYNPGTEQNEFTIHILDPDGKEKKMFSMTDMIDPDIYIQNIVVDDEGDIFLLADQVVLVVGSDGAKLFETKMDNWGNNLIKMNDGTIGVSTYGEKGLKLMAVDKKTKGFGKTFELDQTLYGVNQLYSGSGSYSFYFTDTSYLYGYDVNSGKATEILNWVSSNIGANYINNLCAVDDGSFLCSYYDNAAEADQNDTYGIYRLTKVDPSEVADKAIITYAGVYVDDNIKTQAVRFNKSQDKYQIVIKDYSSSENPVNDMNTDLLAGDIPDIIDLGNLNAEKYIAKGMLLDLYPLMDQDAEINKGDFQENVLSLMETEGKLYRISPTFGINALAGRKKDIGDKKSFTLDDMISIEQQYGKDAKAFHMCSNTSALMQVCSSNYDSYIDWNTGKCSFNTDGFVKLLEYANTYPKEEEIDWDNNYVSLPTAIREKKVVFAQIWSMNMEEMQLYKEMFQDDVVFIGYPSEGPVGPAVTLNSNIGIYAKTANPDGAWAFLKTFLTEEYLEGKGRYFYGGLPLRKDAFEDEIKKYSTKEKYTDKFGNEINPVNSSWGYDDVEVQIGPLSEEQVEMLRGIVASADHLYGYDEEIMNIITEESGAYFSGQKSAKEVADVIQNRVSTYVNESR